MLGCSLDKLNDLNLNEKIAVEINGKIEAHDEAKYKNDKRAHWKIRQVS